MSYVQINIGGKLRGWKANQMTVELFSRHVFEGGEQTSSIYAAMFAGLVANCYVKREELMKVTGQDENGQDVLAPVTFEDVCDWVDELYESGNVAEISKVDECFAASMAYKKMLESINDKLRTAGVDEKKNNPEA